MRSASLSLKRHQNSRGTNRNIKPWKDNNQKRPENEVDKKARKMQNKWGKQKKILLGLKVF